MCWLNAQDHTSGGLLLNYHGLTIGPALQTVATTDRFRGRVGDIEGAVILGKGDFVASCHDYDVALRGRRNVADGDGPRLVAEPP